MSVTLPNIHYTFDSGGTNIGTTGSNNLTLVTDTIIDTTNQLIGSGCFTQRSGGVAGPTNRTVLSNGFSINSTFQISFWFKSKSAGSYQTGQTLLAMGKDVNSIKLFISVTFNPPSLPVQLQFIAVGGSSYKAPSNETYFDNNWHHIYWSGTSTAHQIVIDNVVLTASANIGNPADTINALTIGSDFRTSDTIRVFPGYIDDFRMWTSGNSPSVDYIYKLGKNNPTDVASLSGVPAPTLRAAGATYSQLLVAGYTLTSLLGAPNNYTVAQLYAFGATITQLRVERTVLQLIAGGITIDNLLAASYTYTQLIDNESVTKTQFDSSGKTIQNLVAGGVALPKLITAGYTIPQLLAAPYTFGQLVTGGIVISTLLASPNNYTMSQLFNGGVTISQFISAPYTVLQLISGGITIDNLLAASYTYTQLIDNSVTKTQFDSGGKTIQNLIAGGVTISKLLTAQYSFSQMIAAGTTSTQFTAQSYTIANLKNGGITDTQLLSIGYTFNQFQTEGILPIWSSDASANRIIKSYVKDFVDVSGSIVLRQNSNLYISGNAETAGDLSLNRLFVTADASFNRRIFVGGDVSMNGKVAVRGDLSMNGTVTKCSFNNSSIPKSAFSGTVPDGADYTSTKIVYDQTFQANDDVSMNGATVSANNVTVSGNIVFGDGTVMNTADNNILSTNPNVFKSSTFTALDICGNLIAGSYATSSDYRIKTNVVELDETYTVDKLRPVKYFQTQITREKYGLIAHELQEHYPDLVVGEKDGSELQRVNYTGLIAILINEIKRLKQNLAELESGI